MKWILLFVLILGFIKTSLSQTNINYLAKITLIEKSGKQKVELLETGPIDKPIEGYFYQTDFEKLLYGNISKGGFNFLDPEIFGGIIEADYIREKWAENNFPVKDLEVLTNGIDIGRTLSFHFYPQIKNNNDDSLTLFMKYATFNLLRDAKDYILDYDYNLKLSYKQLKIPFNKEVKITIANDFLDSLDLYIIWNKLSETDEYLKNPIDELLQTEIIKSSKASKVKNKLNIALEFIQDDAFRTEKNSFADFIKRILVKNLITDYSFNNDKSTNLNSPVYCGSFELPFHLFNSQKNNSYLHYKTSDRILRSKYNIIVVPIEYDDKDLVADLFITYSKLQIDDIPRWTPIKKRIKIIHDYGTRIDFPKENWSAVFTRGEEEYVIYGMPDFEEYVNESLIIKFEKGE